MSQNFRHIVISTHKNVEMCRAETMCTFSLRKKFVKKCDIRTYIQTYRQTDIQTYRHVYIHTDMYTDIQRYRQTDIYTKKI